MAHLLHLLALPQVGLSTVFLVAMVSATLLPMGSEPAVFALVQVRPDLFWSTIMVATAGNTLGGAMSYWMGLGAEKAFESVKGRHPRERKAADWLIRFGPKACLLSWLPLVGDPLCAVAGWLKFPFWPCVAYMAAGKFLRYVTMTALLVGIIPAEWTAFLRP